MTNGASSNDLFVLDRASPVPLYHQLEQRLRTAIRTGRLVPGRPLPPEMEIMRRAGVSRFTTRQAIEQLVREGLVTRERGRGTFITAPAAEHATPEEHLPSYLHALIDGDEAGAAAIVERALASGARANDLYLRMFQPAAYEVGRLWRQGACSTAREHLATAIIERQMGELHHFFAPRSHRDRTALIACVDQELHRVGSRMVADFLEQDGWRVHYLGAATPGRCARGADEGSEGRFRRPVCCAAGAPAGRGRLRARAG